MAQVNAKKDTATLVDSVKAVLRDGLKRAGDLIEAGGHKVEEIDVKRIGALIAEWGDKVEHFGDLNPKVENRATGLKTEIPSARDQTEGTNEIHRAS